MMVGGRRKRLGDGRKLLRRKERTRRVRGSELELELELEEKEREIWTHSCCKQHSSLQKGSASSSQLLYLPTGSDHQRYHPLERQRRLSNLPASSPTRRPPLLLRPAPSSSSSSSVPPPRSDLPARPPCERIVAFQPSCLSSQLLDLGRRLRLPLFRRGWIGEERRE